MTEGKQHVFASGKVASDMHKCKTLSRSTLMAT